MISKNSVQILEKHLYQPISLRVQQNCLQILRNLSDQAVKLVRRKNFYFKSKLFSLGKS